MPTFKLNRGTGGGQNGSFGVAFTDALSSGDNCIVSSVDDGSFIVLPNGTTTQVLTSTVPGSLVRLYYSGYWYVAFMSGVWTY